MKRLIKVASAIGLGILCNGNALATQTSCSDRIDQSLCNKLMQVDDTTWVACMIELKREPNDSQVTDPTKDTSTVHDTGSYSPPAYLVAAKDSLFTTYELRWPDTIGYLLAPYPAKNRASTPTTTENHYGVFATKKDILSIGNENYILMIWKWSPDAPASNIPLLKKDWKALQQGRIFNLNGQRVNGIRIQPGRTFPLFMKERH